jgi:hypothetical protein
MKVMFVVLFNEDKVKELLALNEKHITLAIESQNVKYQEADPSLPQYRRASSNLVLQTIIENAKNIQAPPDFDKAFIPIDEFNSKNMGAKSNNLKILKDKLESWIHLPESGTIPFKMLEYTLHLEPEIE